MFLKKEVTWLGAVWNSALVIWKDSFVFMDYSWLQSAVQCRWVPFLLVPVHWQR